MARKFPHIPPQGDTAAQKDALVQTLRYVTGQSQDQIRPLATTATTAEIIAKVNEILARLQGT